MDTKGFFQLVEKKKKRASEEKEASLKWELKLEAASEAKALVSYFEIARLVMTARDGNVAALENTVLQYVRWI